MSPGADDTAQPPRFGFGAAIDRTSTAANRDAEALDRALLASVSAGLGVELDDEQLDRFAVIAAETEAWNRGLNLTRFSGPEDMARLHVADAMAALLGLPEPSWREEDISCIDVGSGTGLPGVALAIVCPRWRVTLVDSVAKKTAFLHHLKDVLPTTRLDVVTARAEDIGRSATHRASYDIVVARAVAEMRVLAEYALPLLRLGGRLIALKGRDAAAETDRASGAFEALGARLVAVEPYRLGGEAGQRYVVVVEKTEPTPDRFPRRAGIPSKRPLG